MLVSLTMYANENYFVHGTPTWRRWRHVKTKNCFGISVCDGYMSTTLNVNSTKSHGQLPYMETLRSHVSTTLYGNFTKSRVNYFVWKPFEVTCQLLCMETLRSHASTTLYGILRSHMSLPYMETLRSHVSTTVNGNFTKSHVNYLIWKAFEVTCQLLIWKQNSSGSHSAGNLIWKPTCQLSLELLPLFSYLLFMSMEGCMGEAFVGVRSKYPAITETYVVDLVTRTFTVHLVPLLWTLSKTQTSGKKIKKIFFHKRKCMLINLYANIL
jgi:hypothetical protein